MIILRDQANTAREQTWEQRKGTKAENLEGATLLYIRVPEEIGCPGSPPGKIGVLSILFRAYTAVFDLWKHLLTYWPISSALKFWQIIIYMTS